MWCRHCQQEVPGVVSPESGSYCCPRCREVLGERTRHARRKTPALAPRPGVAPAIESSESPARPSVIPMPQIALAPRLDDWEVEEQLRHIGRVLAVEDLESARPDVLRIDAAHPEGIARKHRHRPPEREKRSRPVSTKVPQKTPSRGILPFLTWFCTLLGTMGATCGGVLLGWAAWAVRQELWRIGVPIALGGAAVLVVGLLLQLDQSWQDRRTSVGPHPRSTSASCP